jgi:hypothetical protein
MFAVPLSCMDCNLLMENREKCTPVSSKIPTIGNTLNLLKLIFHYCKTIVHLIKLLDYVFDVLIFYASFYTICLSHPEKLKMKIKFVQDTLHFKDLNISATTMSYMKE